MAKKPPAKSPAGGAAAPALSPGVIAQLAEAKAKLEAQRAQQLDALANALIGKRKDAIEGRRNLGIDKQWDEDLEFYEGIDDANRNEIQSADAWHTKLPGQEMPGVAGDVRSTVFVNITRPYCDAASARIADMLMPTDDRAFSIKPTPVPELMDLAQGKLSQAVKVALLNEAQDKNPGTVVGQQHVAPLAQSMIDKATVNMDEAKKRADKAQTRIDDWFVECQYHAEMRKVIEDASKIGTGVIKGPVPVKRTQQIVERDQETGSYVLAKVTEIAPGSKRIDPKNLFPDPACGENIHNGSYLWERDYLSERRLEELKDMPGYLASQIDLCVEEGAKRAEGAAPPPQGEDKGKKDPNIKGLYEVWYFYGVIKRDDLEAIGAKLPEDDDNDQFHALITMVNGRVIKGALHYLDTGDFPFDVINWQRQAGKWTGIGVGRQIRVPQRIVNAGSRNMMDNAGLAGGPQIIIKLKDVTPADGKMELTPRKVWYIAEDADLQDVKQAMGSINIESKQEELMAIIQWGFKIAEDVTGLPLLLQGQQGKAPDTLGGMQMLNNNSSTVLRRLAKAYDDCITEPHVRRYYAWIMQHGDDDEKGDFTIDARGSSALVDRELENQNIVQMGSIVLNPAFGINPKRWFEEYCKSKRLDPKRFQYTDEELKKLQQQQSQQPSDPRIMVAQIRAETEEKLQQAEQAFDAQQKALDRQLDQLIAEINNASKENVTLNDLRTRLAAVAIKARAERERTNVLAGVELHKHHTPAAQAVPPINPQMPVSTALPQ